MKIPPAQLITSMAKSDNVPVGWFTREECQKEWNVSQSRAAHLLRIALENKMVETRKFSIITPRRGIFPTAHYRFKKS
jgi:hypothetical protein